MTKLNSKIPEGPLAEKWTHFKAHAKLVNPANKKKLDIIVVGTGLAGAGAASALGELGYNVKNFCYQDTPRRAHSVAAQGGINAAKNYKNDGDSIYRLFYDMIKGGDYRGREANVYRAAEVSNDVIDHFTALGVPFARDYGGTNFSSVDLMKERIEKIKWYYDNDSTPCGATWSGNEIYHTQNQYVIIYPNPVSDKLIVQSSGLDFVNSYKIYNLVGQIVQEGVIDDQRVQIPVGDLTSGYYIIKISNPKIVIAKKFMKY